MTLAGRSTRRGAGRRWLVLAVVLTLVVILIDASIKARSPNPPRRLAGQEWVDRAYRVVGQANVAGQDLSAFLASSGKVTQTSVDADLADMAGAARGAYRSFQGMRAPSNLAAASGLLQTCLLVRSESTAAIASAVKAELQAAVSTAAASQAAGAVVSAVQRLEVADQAYRLFEQAIPRSLDAPPPTSQWVPPTASRETTAGLAVFLAGLRSRISSAPIYSLAIEALSTTPSAVAGGRKGVETLTASPELTVHVVVGNTGNQVLTGLTVTAAIDLPAPNGASSARNFITALDPGSSQAVSIGYLDPAQGKTVTLT
ncbi:MAG TPA: hypothetical protein VKV25_00080, partial [Acidimicrobiales bacterium]|nr:hypothetical protein [Acidimicrobiales bacterium]